MTLEEIDLYRSVQHRRGELWAEYDKIFCEECGSYDTAISHMNNTNCKGPFIWIAPVWDEDCPERCLIGMIGWCDIFKYKEPDGQPRYTVWHRGCHFQATTLPEALLRAIREQEGKG